MSALTRLMILTPFLSVLLAGTGCSTIAATLGFTPPVHKLIEPAENFRQANVNPAALPKELDKASLPAYIVEPGDSLSVEPADLDSPIRLPGNQPVLQDGTIDLGKFGRPVVAWKTVPQIEADLRKLIDSQSKEDADHGAADRPREQSLLRARGSERSAGLPAGRAGNGARRHPHGRGSDAPSRHESGDPVAAHVAGRLPGRPAGLLQPDCAARGHGDELPAPAGDRIYVPSQPAFAGFCKKRKQGDCGPCKGPQVSCGNGGSCAPGGAPLEIPVAR